MPGLVPGIHVFAALPSLRAQKQSIHPLCRAMDCFAALAMTGPRSNTGTRNIPFIIFVDGMFTSFVARLFTKTCRASKRMRAISCVVHAGHAD